MTDHPPSPKQNGGQHEGPRAVLRVPEILIAVASAPSGVGFAELSGRLGLPKSSLHRLLRTLEQGGYLSQQAGSYVLGPESRRLAGALSGALPDDGSALSVRPVLEWLSRKTGESVIVAELTEARDEAQYIDVINSAMTLRFTVPVGHTRPLYSAAAGQVLLAFLPPDEQARYLESADFRPLTPETLDRAHLARRLPVILEQAAAFDRNGSFLGASAVASPCFDASGHVRFAVAVAGPTERIEEAVPGLENLTREAGERISRILGYRSVYTLRS